MNEQTNFPFIKEKNNPEKLRYGDPFNREKNWKLDKINPTTSKKPKRLKNKRYLEEKIEKLEKKVNELEKKMDSKNLQLQNDNMLKDFHIPNLEEILNDDEEWKNFEEFED